MNALSLCSTHSGRDRVPLGCPTCLRIGLEADIVARVVDVLLAAGHALATDEGDHRFYGPVTPTTNRDEIMAALREVDDEYLGVFTAPAPSGVHQPFGWVRFVYGNDGWDVINDHTVNLTGVLGPVDAYIKEIAP